jgi:hypothetical protein
MNELFNVSIGANHDETVSSNFDKTFLQNAVTVNIKAEKMATNMIKKAGDNLQNAVVTYFKHSFDYLSCKQ